MGPPLGSEGDRLIYLDILLGPPLVSEGDRLIYLDILLGPPLGSEGDRLTWIFCWVLHLVLRVIDLFT